MCSMDALSVRWVEVRSLGSSVGGCGPGSLRWTEGSSADSALGGVTCAPRAASIQEKRSVSSQGRAAGVVSVRRRDRGSSPGSVCWSGAVPVRGSAAVGSATPVGGKWARWCAASVSGAEVESSAATVPAASCALVVCLLRASGSAVSIGGLGAAVAGKPFGRSLRGAASVERAGVSFPRKRVDSLAISEAEAAEESIVVSLCWAVDGGCGVPLVSVPPMSPVSMGERCPPSAGTGPRSSGMSIWRKRSASVACAAGRGGASAAASVDSGSGVGALSGVDAESGAEPISRRGADVAAESVGTVGCASLVRRMGSSCATSRGGAVSGWGALSSSRMSGGSVWAEAEAPARSVCRIGAQPLGGPGSGSAGVGSGVESSAMSTCRRGVKPSVLSARGADSRWCVVASWGRGSGRCEISIFGTDGGFCTPTSICGRPAGSSVLFACRKPGMRFSTGGADAAPVGAIAVESSTAFVRRTDAASVRGMGAERSARPGLWISAESTVMACGAEGGLCATSVLRTGIGSSTASVRRAAGSNSE